MFSTQTPQLTKLWKHQYTAQNTSVNPPHTLIILRQLIFLDFSINEFNLKTLKTKAYKTYKDKNLYNLLDFLQWITSPF
jgi:hypothetical protein